MSAIDVRVTQARDALRALYAQLRERGLGAPADAEGQLIRPLLSLAGAEALGLECDARFWSAAAAVQLAHEASLLHDDVIDAAATRRSAPTVTAQRGVAVALVEGDHLLTTAYRLAAATESTHFFAAFGHAVERTVAGEKLQGRATGLLLDDASYRRIIAGKSGELLGCALSAAAYVADHPCAPAMYVLGRRIGELYQMLDDLLDYCVDADTGKPPLADYRQERWTWPLREIGVSDFSLSADAIIERLTAPGAQPCALRRCVQRFEREADMVRASTVVCLPHDVVVTALVEQWRQRAAAAAERVERAAALRSARAELESLLPDPATLHAFFAANSRTFSFAARSFPRDFRERVARLYAFCRITDDLADAAAAGPGMPQRLARLELWRSLARSAYDGATTGIVILDGAMADASTAGVPFAYVDELIEGMRMDLRGERYATLHDLHRYTYRVAGVIGQWLTRMCGVDDAHVLERAADLGHALQITNILRDAGEDLGMGRVYFPADMMRAAGVCESDLHAMAAGAPVGASYRALLEQLMRRADEHYARALEATAELPPWFRRAVRIAAHVYRGIHHEIRAAGHDNITRRAHTSTGGRMRLALRALWNEPISPPSPAAITVRRRARTAGVTLFLMAATTRLAAQSLPPASHLATVEQRITAAPADTSARIDLVRALFFVAVEHEESVARGHAAVAEIRTSFPQLASSRDALLTAYEGAFTALEAKHGFWPHQRLRAVRSGLSRLDAAVTAAPHDLEIRYLRMVNGFYLPSLFGRVDEVQQDMDVLVRVLPGSASLYPPAIYRVMATFVLEHGNPDDDRAALLRDALRRTDESSP